jgi:hypothetical protein
MRILWWLFLPSVYLLFCIWVSKFLKWASAIDGWDDEELTSEGVPEDTQ